MPKISVIIPIYESEKYIKKCIDSIINQKFSDIEVVCVNDCSPDNCLTILREYQKNDDRIKIINLEKNGGRGNARNIGMKNATGDYIMFIDGDDWFAEDAFEKAYNQITKNNNDVVFYNIYNYYEEDGSISYNDQKYYVLLEQKNQSSINLAELSRPFNLHGACWNKIYNAQFLKNCNAYFFDNHDFEDHIFYMIIMCNAKSISVINEPLYYYRIRGGSAVHSSGYLRECPIAWNIVLDEIPDNTSEIQKDCIYIKAVCANLHWFKKFSKINPSNRESYFYDMQKLFNKFDTATINRIKKYIDYREFNIVRKSKTLKEYDFKYKLDKLFKIERKRKYTRYYFFGLTFKINNKTYDK